MLHPHALFGGLNSMYWVFVMCDGKSAHIAVKCVAIAPFCMNSEHLGKIKASKSWNIGQKLYHRQVRSVDFLHKLWFMRNMVTWVVVYVPISNKLFYVPRARKTGTIYGAAMSEFWNLGSWRREIMIEVYAFRTCCEVLQESSPKLSEPVRRMKIQGGA